MRESEKYYMVPNWVLYIGGGFTPRAGILAIIYSFCSNYGQYNGGTAYLSEQAGCTRRQVFRELHYLTEAGYIIADKAKGETGKVVYTMNAERCEQAKQAYDIQSQADGAAYDTQSQADGAAYDTQSQAYDTQSQAYDIQSQDTINIISNSNSNRERARAHGEFAEIPEHPKIRLTAAELAELKKMQFPTRRRSCLDEYLQALEDAQASGKKYTNHFLTLKGWIKTDTTKPAAGAAPAAEDPAQGSSSRSSIDAADLERLMPGRGSCTG